ncbi:MAG: heme exporter protein CcmB [Myxococcota bacterium]|nr:heme exporter protein CcmB [Myxococcota bacterium]
MNEVAVILKGALAIAQKDWQTEFRSKEILLTMGFFGLLVVLISAFAFYRGDVPAYALAAGSLWVAMAYSGTLGLGRAFEREREGDCIRALLISPMPRQAIFLGKLLGIVSFMFVVELVVVPAVVIFFNQSLELAQLWRLSVVMGLGTLGYGIVGTALAASLLRARTRDVLLAIVIYPVIVPVIMGGVKATTAILQPEMSVADFELWARILLTFDVVFIVVSFWIFEPLLID